jgi:hypothetical protein
MDKFLFNLDKIVQTGILTEKELEKLIKIYKLDLVKIVKYNKLSNRFINTYIIPKLYKNDILDIETINLYQQYVDSIQINELSEEEIIKMKKDIMII